MVLLYYCRTLKLSIFFVNFLAIKYNRSNLDLNDLITGFSIINMEPINFITKKQVPETVAGIPAASMASKLAANDDDQLASLVKSFSWFQLSEQSHSTLSGLKAYYGRIIMNELDLSNPREDKIAEWQAQVAKLAAIERDGSNFKTRERMEEIIIKYSPILKMTA